MAPAGADHLVAPLHATDSPILTATQPWEQHAVFEPTVIYDSRRELWRMWYSGGWDVCALGYADSRDGVHWNKAPSPILGVGVGGVQQACRNNVTVTDTGYLVYFDGDPDTTGLSVAESSDGLTWQVLPEPAVPATTAAPRLVNSTVWRDGAKWRMLVESNSADHIWRTWNAEGATPTRLHITGLAAGLSVGGMFGGPWKDGSTVYFHASMSGNLPTDIWDSREGDAPQLVLQHSGVGWQKDQVADPSIANGLLFFDGVDNATATAAIGLVALGSGD